MINRYRLFMQRIAFFILIFLLTISQSLADAPLVPPYYALDAQHTEPDPSDQPSDDTDPPSATQISEEQLTTVPTSPDDNLSILKNMLTVYQYAAQHDWPIIPDNARFKPGRRNGYVSIIRDRLTLTGDLISAEDLEDKNIFDHSLLEAIKSFQERHGLKADGVIGQKTRQALNVTPQERVKQIEINMQRWEYLSHKLTDRYVMVNVPDFHLYLIEDGKKVLTMKAIVGKPTHQTPEVFSKISTIVFKPYWNVPPKIARKDIMTKAIEDPNYLYENNIHVYRDDDHTNEINDQYVDWSAAREEGIEYHFRQDPGEKNSLGLVKFEFPNPYDVYLHDTPAKNLFSEDVRDFSHGCVRLENPFALVAYLMKDNPKWDDERLGNLLAENKPSYVNVDEPIPVVITYITAWIDENGKLNFRDDIYGRDNEPEYDPNAKYDVVAP